MGTGWKEKERGAGAFQHLPAPSTSEGGHGVNTSLPRQTGHRQGWEGRDDREPGMMGVLPATHQRKGGVWRPHSTPSEQGKTPLPNAGGYLLRKASRGCGSSAGADPPRVSAAGGATETASPFSLCSDRSFPVQSVSRVFF